MITAKRIAAAGLLGVSLLLGGCVYDEAAYGGASLGYGGGDYYGYGYGGWYDDYYYPGSGYYVFDRAGGRHRWNGRQQAYWESHRGDRGGWHGGARHQNGDYDGRRWNRDGRNTGAVVDNGNGNRRQGYDRRGNAAGGTATAPIEGSGFRGDRRDGERATASPQAVREPRQMTREPRQSSSTGRERGEGRRHPDQQ